MISSCTSLLFFFLSVSEPLNPNPFISPPHTHRRPLLLRIRLHRVLRVHLHVGASLLLHVGASLLLHVEAPGNRAVYPAFTAAPENRHRDHAPPPPPGPRLPDLFHL
jgi:hypothetical protein